MSNIRSKKFAKNDAAFTGLEAAIVLIAFVVVAAVFSYVMLGAGFFTSQKSKEVVHTGVDQATSSIQLSGDLVAQGDGTELTNIKITIGLTAGNNPVDVSKITVAGRTVDAYASTLTYTSDFIMPDVKANGLIEGTDKVELTVDVSSLNVNKNEELWLEIKPATGAILNVHMTAPPSIESYMVLY
ncbi:flagellin [Methanocella sp. CWC-04]|uniref:Flagellin n=1 Tax=Methanooceanicella nereidis TaxID=2052831 RepID=A0AAP2RG84_9EURY|nr:archaellin/type IV pilin N-terminal domain-containing protein [Methanocella sp. CWC-04]MCD1296030.1 flagellin [Methanocella sp. CWC-04]